MAKARLARKSPRATIGSRADRVPRAGTREVPYAFDTLEVGPVRFGPRGLDCPYRVRGGRGGSTELRYRYEEDVFDPRDPASANLAALVGAQVALNYGLFCRRIVFHGQLDAADRALLEEMAENTAREIYVNKILKPNPFLVGPITRLVPRTLRRYCRARMVYDGPPAPLRATPRGSVRRNSAYAVLSSGGKESLLTLGLLEELGCNAHSIFVNESGRHWYTSLNAYRELRSSRPSTARVWTDADRLFGWMLHRLDFVRADYARVRADDYPIRLWTVAVFLFGALPLARKRSLTHLLIGCEHDTTRRAIHAGIEHYDGLYDQSILFDRRLTSYYHDKGWGFTQLSLLRPLSELLVQKVLVERYPDLQREQVSCHAAHLSRGRALPCGKCEKCHRVVALLTAVGADPRRCGYSAKQVTRCLRELPATLLHQEESDAAALRALIAAPADSRRSSVSAASRRLLELKVDPLRSPPDLLPLELHDRLWRLWRAHARVAGQGATAPQRGARTASSPSAPHPVRWRSSSR